MTLTVLNVAYPFAPVGPDAVGGAEQMLSALDRALVERGHRSIVIASAGSRVAGELWPVIAEKRILDDAAKASAWSRHRAAIASVRRRCPVDLVHLHGIDFAAYCPERGPTLVTLHLPLDWYSPDALRTRRAGLWMHGVSSSQYCHRPADACLLPPIENGIDTKALAARHAKRDFALFLGRICPEKGVHLAIEAANRAGMTLMIAGQVFSYAAHERYFAEKIVPHLGSGCRFVGPLGFIRKRRFLTAARCLLVPSIAAETSSLVAMEALACGTPVVAFRNGALSEIVTHGRTGFLVDSMKEMAAAVAAVEELDREACRREAQMRFSIERMIAAYLDLYARLAPSRALSA